MQNRGRQSDRLMSPAFLLTRYASQDHPITLSGRLRWLCLPRFCMLSKLPNIATAGNKWLNNDLLQSDAGIVTVQDSS